MRKTLQKLGSSTKNAIYSKRKIGKDRERMTTTADALSASKLALLKLVIAVNAGEIQFLSSRSLSIMESAGLALVKIKKLYSLK